MRKILLASAAAVGATIALTGGAQAQPVKPVAPGTVVVHLNGYLQFDITGFGSTFNKVTSPGTTTYAAGLTAAGTPGIIVAKGVGAGTYKLNDITTNGDARIYPGFDAETLNGIAYGAQVELRTTASDANNGSGRVTGTGGVAGTTGIQVRRAYGYIGSIPGGFVRFGQGDGAFTLLQSGVIEAFGDGAQWNIDGGEASLLPTNATPGNLIYADQANLYSTDKVVYISPSIAGFSFAGSYEPNSNGLKEGYGACASAASLNAAGNSTTCADQSTSPLPGDIGKRRKNVVDAMLQYTVKTDGVLFTASGGVLYGAPINYDGPPTAVGTATHVGYDNLEVYQAGAQATFAGLSVGGNVKAGAVEDGYVFKPRGARDALSYIIGADYTMGPLVIGGSYFNTQSAGAFVPGATITSTTSGPIAKTGIARTLSEYGAAAGANLVISKNLSLFVQYLYGHRKQIGNAALNLHGNAQVQAIGAGGTFKW